VTRLKILPGQKSGATPRIGRGTTYVYKKAVVHFILWYCDHGNQNGYITEKNQRGSAFSYFSNLPQNAEHKKHLDYVYSA
jgi:hypothetical protein